MPCSQDSAIGASKEDMPLYVALDPGAVTPNNRLDDVLVIAPRRTGGGVWGYAKEIGRKGSGE